MAGFEINKTRFVTQHLIVLRNADNHKYGDGSSLTEGAGVGSAEGPGDGTWIEVNNSLEPMKTRAISRHVSSRNL